MSTHTITLTAHDSDGALHDIDVQTITCDRCDHVGVCVDCDYATTIARTVSVKTDDPDGEPYVDVDVTAELPDDVWPLMAGATGGHAADRVYCESCADEVGAEIEAEIAEREATEALSTTAGLLAVVEYDARGASGDKDCPQPGESGAPTEAEWRAYEGMRPEAIDDCIVESYAEGAIDRERAEYLAGMLCRDLTARLDAATAAE